MREKENEIESEIDVERMMTPVMGWHGDFVNLKSCYSTDGELKESN